MFVSDDAYKYFVLISKYCINKLYEKSHVHSVNVSLVTAPKTFAMLLHYIIQKVAFMKDANLPKFH